MTKTLFCLQLCFKQLKNFRVKHYLLQHATNAENVSDHAVSSLSSSLNLHLHWPEGITAHQEGMTLLLPISTLHLINPLPTEYINTPPARNTRTRGGRCTAP